MNNFITSYNGFKLIQEFEGFASSPYLDGGGIPTIGYGSTYYNDGSRVKLTDSSITKEDALVLFKHTIKKFEDTINTQTSVQLNQNQFDALVSFIYNIGPANFKSSTLLKLLNTGDFIKASDEFTRWNKDNGKVVVGLTKRREAERLRFLEEPK